MDLDLVSDQSDTYYFTPTSSGLYKVTVTGEFDALLIVFDPNGNKLAADDDTDHVDEYYHQANVLVHLEELNLYSIFVRMYGSDVEFPSAVLFAKKVK